MTPTPEQKELYEKTMRRLRRTGCFDVTEQIIYLAEEIEQYRARIQGMEQMQAMLPLDPEEKVWRCYVNAWTPKVNGVQPEENLRIVKDEMARRLAGFLVANGAIEYTTEPCPEPMASVEHTAVLRVVMPKKEAKA
jgi:hypothetical protein